LSASQITVVTALVDLASRETGQRRDIDWYLERCDDVLSTRHNLVVFTEPDLVEILRKKRSSLAPNSQTRVLGIPLEKFPQAERRNAIAQAFREGRRPPTASNHDKDTPAYLSFTWSKPGLLELAATEDNFSSTMYWWSDIALLQVAQPLNGDTFDSVIKSYEGEFHANVLWETDASEYEDRNRFYASTPFSKIAGGLFGVSTQRVSRFRMQFDREVERCLATGWPTIEEVILGVVVDRHRDHAEMSYGPWETLLSNFNEPRDAAWHRFRLLHDCINRGLHDRALSHFVAIESASENGRLPLGTEQLRDLENLRPLFSP